MILYTIRWPYNIIEYDKWDLATYRNISHFIESIH